MVPLSELKDWLDVTGTDDDNLLTNMEKRAVAFLEEQTNRYFGAERTVVEIVSGAGDDVLWLREPPVSITSVERRDAIGTGWETVDSTYYELDPINQRKLFRLGGYVWAKGRRNYKITYKDGYATGSEPLDVYQAVIDLVAAQYRTMGAEGVKSERMGDYQYTIADINDMPRVRETISAWRRIRV